MHRWPGVPRAHARGVHWVEPVLVAEVAYRTWTPDGRLRHPSWRGLHPDKTPDQIQRVPVSSVPAREAVEAAMQTPEGQWRVEIVRRGDSRWYRIVHGDDLVDWLSIAAVERILDQAGVPSPSDDSDADSNRPGRRGTEGSSDERLSEVAHVPGRRRTGRPGLTSEGSHAT